MAFPLKQQKDLQVNATTVAGATYTVLRTDDIIHSTYSATGAVTITIPTALMAEKKTITIKDAGGNAGTNNITIATQGAETIDGGATYKIINDYDAITLYSNGVGWFII